MRKQVETYFFGFLFCIWLVLGTYALRYGTEVAIDQSPIRRGLEALMGLAIIGSCGWWLIGRSSRSQLFITLALTIAVGTTGSGIILGFALGGLGSPTHFPSPKVIFFMIAFIVALIHFGSTDNVHFGSSNDVQEAEQDDGGSRGDQ